jgi:two-component system, NarL family, nitrate/nitrite response regulator NarL
MMKSAKPVIRAARVMGSESVLEPNTARATPLKATRSPVHRDSSPNIRIVIADNFPIFRDGLRRVLETQTDFLIVGEASDGAEAFRLTSEVAPDVLLLDRAMPGLSGLDVLRELVRAGIAVKTILMAAEIDKTEKIRCFQSGASGVVLKEIPTHLLVKSIRTVATGGYWIGRETVSDLVQALAQSEIAGGVRESHKCGLTPRELEMLALIVSGYANKDIAQKCSVSEDTVKHHLTNIFDKTGVSNRLELALFAIHHRLVGQP